MTILQRAFDCEFRYEKPQLATQAFRPALRRGRRNAHELRRAKPQRPPLWIVGWHSRADSDAFQRQTDFLQLGADMNRKREFIERLVLAIHRRNGGTARRLEWRMKLLDPALALDSLDLAEVIVAIEREFGRSPFDGEAAPKTWEDVVLNVGGGRAPRRGNRNRHEVRCGREDLCRFT